MNQKPSTVALRLMNLYRQQHVILGGWAAVNPIFIADATDAVITELQNMPAANFLIAHIANLRSGKTPMDSIAPELMPYGGMMTETAPSISLTESEISELRTALDGFKTDADSLAKIQSMNVVKRFGQEWQVAIRAALAGHSDLSEKWATVTRTARAFELWKIANDLLAAPISERARAQIQAELPEYETYLPMFGDAGREVLVKLRTYISSI